MSYLTGRPSPIPLFSRSTKPRCLWVTHLQLRAPVGQALQERRGHAQPSLVSSCKPAGLVPLGWLEGVPFLRCLRPPTTSPHCVHLCCYLFRGGAYGGSLAIRWGNTRCKERAWGGSHCGVFRKRVLERRRDTWWAGRKAYRVFQPWVHLTSPGWGGGTSPW